MSRVPFVAASVLLALVAGCSPASTPTSAPPASSTTTIASTPSASPTFQCTPEAGGSASPCDEKAYEAMKAKDALYAEAEQVLQRFLVEDGKQQYLSGHPVVTPEIEAVTTGGFLEGLRGIYQSLAAKQLKGDRTPQVGYIRRAPGLSKSGSVVALAACIDGSSVKVTQAGAPYGSGHIVKGTYFLAQVGDQLKIITSEGGQVSSC